MLNLHSVVFRIDSLFICHRSAQLIRIQVRFPFTSVFALIRFSHVSILRRELPYCYFRIKLVSYRKNIFHDASLINTYFMTLASSSIYIQNINIYKRINRNKEITRDPRIV